MTDYFLGVAPQSMEWELRSNVSRFQSPMGGVTRTLERVGSRWAATWRWDAVAGENAARLKSFLATQRGGANRFWAYDPGYTMRGAYSAPELFSNPEFANGTSGWTANNATLTAPDRELRLTVTTPVANVETFQSVSLAQYAAHALRSILVDGRQTAGLNIGRFINGGVVTLSDYGTARGLGTVAIVSSSASAISQFPAVFLSVSGFSAGAYLAIPFTSLARCVLVDNGPNLLLRSDELDNAVWTKNGVTISANAVNSPDGTTTADDLVEDTSTGEHVIYQSATRSNEAADAVAYGMFARRVGTRNVVLRVDDGSANGGICVFDLGSGAKGTEATIGTGTNPRAFIKSMGSGYYYCALVARLPASTSVRCIANISNGSTSTVPSYTGSGSLEMVGWRIGVALSSIPTRGAQTTSAATSGSNQTGSALYLKGLPASTNGLLLAGDWIEFITPTYSELKRVTAPLNSDAAGLGYLQFEPILRASPVDNAAVIISKPMARFMMDNQNVSMTQVRAGVYSCSFTAVEDVAT